MKSKIIKTLAIGSVIAAIATSTVYNDQIVSANTITTSKIAESITYYRVVAGSFKNKDNAEARVKKLKKKKIDSYIVSKNIKGTIYYRVVVGTFEKEKNAEALQERYEDLGYDVFIDIYY